MSGNYAPAVSIADAIKYKNHTDDCIKEVDAAIVRFMTMQRQLIAQKDYIEACTTSALGDTGVSDKTVDYRAKLYKHRAFIGKSVEGTWVYKMDAGGMHSLVLDHAGKVHSFGDGNAGQLGLNSTTIKMTPQLIAEIIDGKTIIEISAGAFHSLVLGDMGDVYSFGYGWLGRLGHGDNYSSYRPQKIEHLGGTKIKAISAGDNHSLVLDDVGDVYSFGGNAAGQLGHRDNHNIYLPKKIDMPTSAKKIKAISAGGNHSLVLDHAGKVHSFGENGYGQLGLNSTTNKMTPQLIAEIIGGKTIIEISAGQHHSLVLDDVGDVYSFGRGIYGQLGHGDDNNINLPKKIDMPTSAKKIIAISAGGGHSLVLDDVGDVYSFGWGGKGQLGHGDDNNINLPKKIDMPTSAKTIVAISAGFLYNHVLDNMGNVYSFGENGYGQLGRGNDHNINVPAKTDDITAYWVIPDPHAGANPMLNAIIGDYLTPAAKRASKLFNSSQILPGVTTSDVDPERIVLTDDKEVFNGVDITGTKQFLIGVNSILTHPNNISETLVPGSDVDQPYKTGTYPYRAGAKHELSTGVLKGLLMQGNENITGTASYNTILTAIPNTGKDVDTSSTEPFKKIRGFGLN